MCLYGCVYFYFMLQLCGVWLHVLWEIGCKQSNLGDVITGNRRNEAKNGAIDNIQNCCPLPFPKGCTDDFFLSFSVSIQKLTNNNNNKKIEFKYTASRNIYPIFELSFSSVSFFQHNQFCPVPFWFETLFWWVTEGYQNLDGRKDAQIKYFQTELPFVNKYWDNPLTMILVVSLDGVVLYLKEVCSATW